MSRPQEVPGGAQQDIALPPKSSAAPDGQSAALHQNCWPRCDRPWNLRGQGETERNDRAREQSRARSMAWRERRRATGACYLRLILPVDAHDHIRAWKSALGSGSLAVVVELVIEHGMRAARADLKRPSGLSVEPVMLDRGQSRDLSLLVPRQTIIKLDRLKGGRRLSRSAVFLAILAGCVANRPPLVLRDDRKERFVTLDIDRGGSASGTDAAQKRGST